MAHGSSGAGEAIGHIHDETERQEAAITISQHQHVGMLEQQAASQHGEPPRAGPVRWLVVSQALLVACSSLPTHGELVGELEQVKASCHGALVRWRRLLSRIPCR